MAVAILDAFASTGATSEAAAGSFSVSAGSDRLLVLVMGYKGSEDTIEAVSFGGQAMTPQVAVITGGGFPARIRVWTLNNQGIIDASDTNFAVTGDANGEYRSSAGSFSGVNQTTPLIAADGDISGTSPLGITSDTVTDGFSVAAAICSNQVDITWANTTERVEVDGGSSTHSVATVATTSAAGLTPEATFSTGAFFGIAQITLSPVDATLPSTALITSSSAVAAASSVAVDSTALVTSTSSIAALTEALLDSTALITTASELAVASAVTLPSSAVVTSESAITAAASQVLPAAATIDTSSIITALSSIERVLQTAAIVQSISNIVVSTATGPGPAVDIGGGGGVRGGGAPTRRPNVSRETQQMRARQAWLERDDREMIAIVHAMAPMLLREHQALIP